MSGDPAGGLRGMTAEGRVQFHRDHARYGTGVGRPFRVVQGLEGQGEQPGCGVLLPGPLLGLREPEGGGDRQLVAVDAGGEGEQAADAVPAGVGVGLDQRRAAPGEDDFGVGGTHAVAGRAEGRLHQLLDALEGLSSEVGGELVPDVAALRCAGGVAACHGEHGVAPADGVRLDAVLGAVEVLLDDERGLWCQPPGQVTCVGGVPQLVYVLAARAGAGLDHTGEADSFGSRHQSRGPVTPLEPHGGCGEPVDPIAERRLVGEVRDSRVGVAREAEGLVGTGSGEGAVLPEPEHGGTRLAGTGRGVREVAEDAEEVGVVRPVDREGLVGRERGLPDGLLTQVRREYQAAHTQHPCRANGGG
nr:hypothetical protein [Streptomyces lonarensis]